MIDILLKKGSCNLYFTTSSVRSKLWSNSNIRCFCLGHLDKTPTISDTTTSFTQIISKKYLRRQEGLSKRTSQVTFSRKQSSLSYCFTTQNSSLNEQYIVYSPPSIDNRYQIPNVGTLWKYKGILIFYHRGRSRYWMTVSSFVFPWPVRLNVILVLVYWEDRDRCTLEPSLINENVGDFISVCSFFPLL